MYIEVGGDGSHPAGGGRQRLPGFERVAAANERSRRGERSVLVNEAVWWHFDEICDLVGGYNGKNDDKPEEDLLLLLLYIVYYYYIEKCPCVAMG